MSLIVGILEQRLERAEADHLVDDVVDQRVELGGVDRHALLAGLFRHEIMHLPAHLVLGQALQRDQIDLLDQHAVDAHARIEHACWCFCRTRFPASARERLAVRRDDHAHDCAAARLLGRLRPARRRGSAASRSGWSCRLSSAGPCRCENSERDFSGVATASSGRMIFFRSLIDIGVRIDLVQRHAAVDRLAHQPVVVGDAADEMVAEDFLDVGLLDAVFEHASARSG